MYFNLFNYGRLTMETKKETEIKFKDLNIFQQLNLLFEYYLNINEILFNETNYLDKFTMNDYDTRSHSNVRNFLDFYFAMFPSMGGERLPDSLVQKNQFLPKNFRKTKWKFITVNPKIIRLGKKTK